MRETYFNSCVNKLSKYRQVLLPISKIKNIIEMVFGDNHSQNKTYKMIYYLKNKWYLLGVKKDLILVKSPKDSFTDGEIADAYYRESLRLHVKEYCYNDRYIWSIKALELNIENYEIPEEIDIYNKSKVSFEVVILDKKMLFKTYKQKSKNLRPKFKKRTKEIYVRNQKLNIACLELAMLESLYSPNLVQKWYVNELLKNIIRKYKKKINLTIFEEIIQTGKHQSSLNRLYDIAKSVDPTLANQMLSVIKKHSYLLDL